jgi:hypothetical protein
MSAAVIGARLLSERSHGLTGALTVYCSSGHAYIEDYGGVAWQHMQPPVCDLAATKLMGTVYGRPCCRKLLLKALLLPVAFVGGRWLDIGISTILHLEWHTQINTSVMVCLIWNDWPSNSGTPK